MGWILTLTDASWARKIITLFLCIVWVSIVIRSSFVLREYFARECLYRNISVALCTKKYVKTIKSIENQKVLIERIRHNKNVANVIIGSSHVPARSESISSRYNIFYHTACSIKNIHEILDCFLYYHKQIPKNLILELWAGSFNPNPKDHHPLEKFSSLSPFLYDIKSLGQLLARKIDQLTFAELFSQRNLETFSISASNTLPIFNEDEMVSAQDGRIYGIPEKVNLQKDCVRFYEHYNFQTVSTKGLIELLDRIKSLGATVQAVYLVPLSPIFIEYMKKKGKYSLVSDSENACRIICKEKNIPLIGTHNPAVHNFIQEDFYDADHPKPHVHEKLLEKFIMGLS